VIGWFVGLLLGRRLWGAWWCCEEDLWELGWRVGFCLGGSDGKGRVARGELLWWDGVVRFCIEGFCDGTGRG